MSSAHSAIDWENETYSGDWNGLRKSWSDKGVDSEILLKGTLISNRAGAMRRGGAYMQNLELKIEFDTGKLWNVTDSSVYLHAILNSGGKVNESYVGSLMGVDNSEVPDNDLKLYEAWFNKNFFDSTLSVLAGIYAADSEFYVNDASGLFIHPSFGMAAEVAQTGRDGPSAYPVAALGARVKYQPNNVFYVMGALMDGDPGTGRNPHWTKVNPFHGDGALVMAEMGYRPGEAHHVMSEPIQPESTVLTTAQKLEERYEQIGKYAIGYWTYSERSEDVFATDVQGNSRRGRNQGYYLLMENTLYRAKNMEREISAFFRYGVADEDLNTFDYSASLGLRVRGLISGRHDDFFGVALTRAHASDKYRLAQQAAGVDIPSAETAIELTYRAQVRPWMAVQPVLERIINPGLDPALSNSTVLGARFEVIF